VIWLVALLILILASVAAALTLLIRARNLQYWLGSALFGNPMIDKFEEPERDAFAVRVLESPLVSSSGVPTGGMTFEREAGPRRDDSDEQTQHIFIAICDHYEPEWGRPEKRIAIERVERWRREYPKRFSQFEDCTGRPPQHTFFYPQDEYAPEYLDLLAELCQEGYGDVDIHLHHDHDTEATLRSKLADFRDVLFERHHLLRTDPLTGRPIYGFIHGNWALCNSRPDGRWCGVNDEIRVLRETGCYADFTMPSAPSPTQTRTINSIYYARSSPDRCKSHDVGVPARAGVMPPDDALLMIQGPLLLDWKQRKFGCIPKIENGDLHGGRPATAQRLDLWLKAGVTLVGRPNWRFIKLHTHGAKESNAEMLLGAEMQRFHDHLATRHRADPRFRYYYVTAWEMAQLVHRAEISLDQVSTLFPPASNTFPQYREPAIHTTTY